MNQNLAAFLAMIAHSEGTDRTPDPYRCCFGFKHTIIDLSNHPAVTGEWHGESLASLGPEYVGLVSTAAGKYQVTKPTWLGLQSQLNLPDFTGPSQDAAAVGLIRNKNALDLVQGGQVAAAITACRGVWASLPGNTYGQPITSFADLIRAYTAAGGAFA